MTATVTVEPSRPTDEDLPVNPFSALRVAFGMLLGVDDFHQLMGNPRGKGMLHNAWLHGSGVLWGYAVAVDANRRLEVGPGLALDGLGRELRLDEPCCVDLPAWVDEQSRTDAWQDALEQGNEGEVCACVVASFVTCLARPVPSLADPCDLDRRTTDESRVVERVGLELRLGACPQPPRPGPFHRIRVFLGLDPVEGDDPAGEEARRCAERIAAAGEDDRRAEICDALHRLAGLDVADRQPAVTPGGTSPGLFPGTEDEAGVVLAEVCMVVRPVQNGYEICEVRPPEVRSRPSLLPTALLQELVCGVLAASSPPLGPGDAGGPRVVPGSVAWTGPTTVELDVTSTLFEPSVTPDGFVVSSLSGQGWVAEHVVAVDYDETTARLSVELQEEPASSSVRLIVRGTGPTPIMGDNFVPLAGVVGGPPASFEGRDAVLTVAAGGS